MRPPPLADLDAVLFDAGGTLLELDFVFISETARQRSVSVQPDALRRGEVVARHRIDGGARRTGGVEGRDEDRRFRYFSVLLESAGVPPGAAAPIVEALEAAHAADNLWRIEIEGAAPTLSALRERGLSTGVISNADGRVESILNDLCLSPHLTVILDSHLEGVEKPDPEIFQRALARLGIRPSRAAYVGDIYSIDAVGARAAGVAPVLLDPLGGYPDVDCATIASLRELLP
jgi:putative hydrolase of the HAD superfamily